jgi:hypothetical protein
MLVPVPVPASARFPSQCVRACMQEAASSLQRKRVAVEGESGGGEGEAGTEGLLSRLLNIVVVMPDSSRCCMRMLETDSVAKLYDRVEVGARRGEGEEGRGEEGGEGGGDGGGGGEGGGYLNPKP